MIIARKVLSVVQKIMHSLHVEALFDLRKGSDQEMHKDHRVQRQIPSCTTQECLELGNRRYQSPMVSIAQAQNTPSQELRITERAFPPHPAIKLLYAAMITEFSGLPASLQVLGILCSTRHQRCALHYNTLHICQGTDSTELLHYLAWRPCSSEPWGPSEVL